MANPIHVTFDGVRPSSDTDIQIYAHPVFVNTAAAGPAFMVNGGTWSSLDAANVVATASRIEADLTALAVVAPWSASAEAGYLSITPAQAAFDTITTEETASKTFTLSNTGTETLTGVATAAAPFEIVSGGTYTLSPGQSQAVVVLFAPAAAGDYAAALGFTGGGGANALVTGSATSSKTQQTFGCGGAEPAGSGSPWADVLFMAGILGGLLLLGRRSAARRV